MFSFNRYSMTAAAVFAAAAIDVAAFSAQAGKSVWDGVYSEAQSTRGQDLSKASCVTCHGNELAGTDLAPALQGDDFKGVWSGRTAAELFEKIQTTMPADRVGTLKPPQSADLVAYILKMNNYPAGAAELGSEIPALQQIKITGRK
jgi:S-disulfanyl-L-cysteine oxidoreductase SoxD